MKHTIRLAMLASAVALAVPAQAQGQSQSQSQEPPKYQSVAPKKSAPKPADPADISTLTGRPVPPSVAAKPVPRDPAEDNYDPQARKGAPLNQDDVDVLTGKYDEQRLPGYQRYGYAEDLWTLEWMERHGYGPGDSFFRADGYGRDRVFVPGVFGRGGRPLFFHHRHRFGGHGLRHFLRGGTFFFFP
jgi:hypothetical protein